MNRFRFSIAGLLAFTALLGVVLATLTHPAPLWGSGFLSLTLATLMIALLAAIYRSGRRRAFWVGFATCGWSYFLLLWGPAPISNLGPNLVTTAIIDILYPWTVPATAGQAASGPADREDPPTKLARTNFGGSIILAGAFGGGGFPMAPPPTPWQVWTTSDRAQMQMGPPGALVIRTSPLPFRLIAHSLLCLMAATIGAIAARYFHLTRDEPVPAGRSGDRPVTSRPV